MTLTMHWGCGGSCALQDFPNIGECIENNGQNAEEHRGMGPGLCSDFAHQQPLERFEKQLENSN